MKTIRFAHLAIAATLSILSACGEKKKPQKTRRVQRPGLKGPMAPPANSACILPYSSSPWAFLSATLRLTHC